MSHSTPREVRIAAYALYEVLRSLPQDKFGDVAAAVYRELPTDTHMSEFVAAVYAMTEIGD